MGRIDKLVSGRQNQKSDRVTYGQHPTDVHCHVAHFESESGSLL